jgi:deoxyribose-phosphate aldolase
MTLKAIAQQTLGLIDLTTLNDNDTNEIVIELCKKTKTEFGSVPAICIFRQFIPAAKKYFAENGSAVKIATVTNFPHGGTDMTLALRETQEAIDLGADEVDIVFPYRALMAGDTAIGGEMIKRAKQICGKKVLKVIIESGVLQDPKLIELASDISIANGADFIKTSTGKVEVNATLEATEVMLNSIKKVNSQCGFKAAGGIRSVAEAKDYIELTNRVMGKDWINATKFRFGASSILTDVLNILNDRESVINSNLY